MKHKSVFWFFILLGALMMSSQTFSAPPQNAIDACQDNDEGDICSFTNEHGNSVEGDCKYLSNDESYLVCEAYQ